MTEAITTLTHNIEAFSAGDFDRYADTLADGVVYVEAGTQRRTEGKEANLELMRAWKASFPDAKGTITNIFGSGDQAVAEITWTGTHSGDLEGTSGIIPASGRQIEVAACITVSALGGEITEAHQYFDLMTLLAQIGAVPEPAAAT